MIVSPPKYYEVNGQVTPVIGFGKDFAVGNNQQVIAAVTGKIIRVMGFSLQSTTAVNSLIYLKNGSGGGMFHIQWTPASNQPIVPFDVCDGGYFECSVSTGLYTDVVTAAGIVNVNYIVYTP